MDGTRRYGKVIVSALAAAAMATTALVGCGSSDRPQTAAATHGHAGSAAAASAASDFEAELALYTTMRKLWAEHMEWTYATVSRFAANSDALQPTLDRLLQNQRDIGAAIVPYYGKAAGDKLTELLLTHIKQAVPVLEAARDGDKEALDKAVDAWYANAKQIADFLSDANPDNWPRSAMERMLKQHITQTIAYSVDLLKNDFAKSIKDYDKAREHMMKLADTLSEGIIAQFPEKFSS